MPHSRLHAEAAALRAFNRLYTRRLGLLNERLDGSPFGLTEARVLYELAHATSSTAAGIARALGLDKAQLSRILKRFGDQDLVVSTSSEHHAKHQLLSLTKAGRAAFNDLNRSTDGAVAELLNEFSDAERRRLLRAVGELAEILGDGKPVLAIPRLRAPVAGDLTWAIHRESVLRAREDGSDTSFEGRMARLVGDFTASFDPRRDGAWVAESQGCMVGALLLKHGGRQHVASVRLLYLERDQVDSGAGPALFAACIESARKLGYRMLELVSPESPAKPLLGLYEECGFLLKSRVSRRSTGKGLDEQVWSRQLD